MKNFLSPACLLLFALVSACSLADEPKFDPEFGMIGAHADAQENPVTLARRSNPFRDFRLKIDAAIASRDINSIMALYQTNGVAAEALRVEVARWRQTLPQNAGQHFVVFGKELRTLPSAEAREFWSEHAHRLTHRPVTHLAMVHGTGVQLIVPLVLSGERLLIVPSDAAQ